MMGDAHARLGASSAHRWLRCTKCVQLEEQFEETPSVSAEEGTLAHALAYLEISDRLRFIESEVYIAEKRRLLEGYDEAGLEALQVGVHTYVEAVLDLYQAAKERCSDTQILLEQRVDFSPWVREGFGTADAILIGDGVLQVIDLKYGYRRVEAEDNPQLKLYALGAYYDYSVLYAVQQVKMTIVQPRLHHVGTAELVVEDLLEWGEQVVKPQAELAFWGEGTYVAGEHCKFCRARQTCRTRGELSLDLMRYGLQSPEVFAEEEMGELLTKIGRLVDWAKDVTDYAYEQALNQGKTYTGWKVVAGRSTRKYRDSEAVACILQDAGYLAEQIYETKLLPLTAMEKVVGKQQLQVLLGELVVKQPGKPVLVPEKDKRCALTRDHIQQGGVCNG